MATQEEMIICAREALALGTSATVTLSPFEGRGSDRAFFRLTWNGKGSAILILYDPNRIENTYYADIDLFLHNIGVPAPRLIRHDPSRCLIVMEDLGDTDLWWFRESAWETRLTLYQKTLVIVHRLHSFPEKEFPSQRVRLMEGFDSNLYRWERDYFRVNFVGAVCEVGLGPAFERDIEIELSALAERLNTGPRCLLHRDLQSQNVMIRDGEPFLIDFQGMRFGNPLYDLGSLLYDPYVDFSSDERDELLLYYYGLAEQDLDWSTFRNQFWEASTQRLMQALGAYGFLGLNKGLSVFLEHVPAGLRNLQQAASHAPLLARLQELLQVCKKAMGQRGKSEGRLL